MSIVIDNKQQFSNKQNHLKATEQVKNRAARSGTIALALLPLAACGGGGSGPTTTSPPPPQPIPDFTEDHAGTFTARDDNNRTLDEASATADLIVLGKGGDDSITTGAGADMIRGGDGADMITAGAGDDIIVVVGTTTAGQYTDVAITNPAGSGVDISSLITLADLNGRTVSEVVSGEVIDGGAGNNTLYIYGIVDLTGVTLSNVTQMIINSDVTLTPQQLAQFTTIDGDGNSVINIIVAEGAGDVILDLSMINISDVGAINITGDITIRINDAEDFAGINQISVGDTDKLTLDITSGNGSSHISLADIADAFDQLDQINLTDKVTLNVSTAEDITSLGLSQISGNGSIDVDGATEVLAAFNNIALSETININPVIGSPSFNFSEGAATTLNSDDFDIMDVDYGDDLILIQASNITHGYFDKDGVTVSEFSLQDVADGLVRFIHDGGEDAPAFEISVKNDGTGAGFGSPIAAVIDFSTVNDAPSVGGAVALSTPENAPLVITVDDLLAQAVDEEGDSLTIQNLILTGAGSLVANGDNTWTYTPATNSFGRVSLSYDVSDGSQTVAASADLTIHEITFTIPFGDFEGTVLHFNDPLLPFQSNILGFMNRNTAGYDDGVMSVPHINIIPVWEEYSGQGVRIASIETMDNLHPDLADNYLQELYSVSDPNITFSNTNYHGTATAGLVSAVADNGIGLVGVAYGATITSLTHMYQSEHSGLFDVITNSTGTASTEFFSEGTNEGAVYLKQSLNTGRDGLGTIHVIAVGNGAANDHSTEASGYNNFFELMPVGLINSSGTTGFTDFGPGVHISAPVSTLEQNTRGITLDRLGDIGLVSIAGSVLDYRSFDPVDFFPYFEDLGFKLSDLGLDTGNYTTLGGSSAATPVVAGAVALVLEASGNNIFDSSGLGWRDVQEILALSARQIGSDLNAEQPFSSEHHGWAINGADNFNGSGMHFSPDFGFGMLDVHGAVRLAETWTLQRMTTNLIIEDVAVTLSEIITYGEVIELSFDMTARVNLDLDVVSLDFDFTHDKWSELLITLISPDGTESIVFDTPGLTGGNPNSYGMNGQLIWTVLSRTFWGEESQGIWTIRIEDTVDNGNSGSLDSITAHFQGDLATDDDTYFFTDDWALMNDANGGIPVIDDATGQNSINAAAVSGNVSLDMSAGATSQIDGVDAFTMGAETDISLAITGDGDDVIRGLDAGDKVYAMRGDDQIKISDDTFALIDAGAGEDVLVFDGSGLNFDLGLLTLANLEAIDITGSGDNSLSLDLQDLLDTTDLNNQLIIQGDAGDSVTSTEQGWIQGQDLVIDNETYHVYTSDIATLLIDTDITQDIT